MPASYIVRINITGSLLPLSPINLHANLLLN